MALQAGFPPPSERLGNKPAVRHGDDNARHHTALGYQQLDHDDSRLFSATGHGATVF